MKVMFLAFLAAGFIAVLADLGLDILDIGAAIMDAPLLDMKLDVIGVVEQRET